MIGEYRATERHQSEPTYGFELSSIPNESSSGTCNGTYGNTTSGSLPLTMDVLTDKSGLTVSEIPYNSIAVVSFDLADSGDLSGDSVLSTLDLQFFLAGWRTQSDLGDMDFDGDTDRDDWFYLRAAFNDAGLANQFAAFFVPEPAGLPTMIVAALLLPLGFRRRRRRRESI